MKILMVIGPALGILNHSIALSKLLAQRGHLVSWLTAPTAAEHLKSMQFEFPVLYSQTHEICFDRENPNRKPHLHQVCDYQYLVDAVKCELEAIEKFHPDLIITKHHYSVPLSASLLSLPFATYYTDGGEYLIQGRNPQANRAEPSLVKNFKDASRYFNIPCKEQPLVNYIKSPHLNMIRGIPLLSSLSKEEQEGLSDTDSFGGLLFYDGPGEDSELLRGFDKNLPIIYVTFGTICRDIHRFKTMVTALKNFQANVVISTVNIDPEALYPCPSHIFLRRYIPNQIMLQKADLVIHHGGHGTMLSAFLYGVPQIVIPDNIQSSAQSVHAETVVRLGVGRMLAPDQFSASTVAKEIQEVLSDPLYKTSANSLRKAVREQDLLYNDQLVKRIQKISNKEKSS